jgi:hypothetical protein
VSCAILDCCRKSSAIVNQFPAQFTRSESFDFLSGTMMTVVIVSVKQWFFGDMVHDFFGSITPGNTLVGVGLRFVR